MRWIWLRAATCGLCVGACADEAERPEEPADAVNMEAIQPALATITPADLLRHTAALADDSMEGRSPGSVGEERTVRYLEAAFRSMGLGPGNPDGTYIQNVPLVSITPQVTATLAIGGRTVPLQGVRDYIASSRRVAPEVKVENSDVVFVGYGVVAPEYGWDDYKDVDVRGKTIVMLINDPPVAHPNAPNELDPATFGGRAMTYYGRWTYKYEIAAQRGAAAALIVHEEGPAGYPYEVVSGSWGRENFDLVSPTQNKERALVEGWLRLDKARELCAAGGADFDALKVRARTREFRPQALNVRAELRVTNKLRQ